MDFKLAPLKQNTVQNATLGHTSSASTSVSLATKGFMGESWRAGDGTKLLHLSKCIFCIR